MKKILAIALIAFSPLVYANETQIYQPNVTYGSGIPKYHTIRNIPGGIETVGYAYYDNIARRGFGTTTIQWYPGYHRTIVLYPPNEQGRVYRHQQLSQYRNSQTNFSPIITVEFSGFIN